MTKVIADISMSLDGFVTGPNPGLDNGLGDGGEPLHTWAMASDDPVDTEVLQESADLSGAVIMGRRLFDIIDGPDGWGEDVGYGAAVNARPVFFCVTHSPPSSRRLVDHDFRFVGSIADAVDGARAVATPLGKDVVVMGGGDVIAQVLGAGLADELTIHLAPLVLGAGTPLFPAGADAGIRLDQRAVVVSPCATHLTYSVVAA